MTEEFGPIREEMISRYWQSGPVAGRVIEWDQPFEVIYPGRRHSAGPDFADAVVSIGGKRTCGDIEIHVRASDWQAHQHHLNPRYNNVVLHIVSVKNTSMPIRTSEGRPVPTAVVNPGSLTLPLDMAENRGSACPGTRQHFIAQAGIDRLKAKANLFEAELGNRKPEEVLYSGIATALGYRENAAVMKQLALTVPLEALMSSWLPDKPTPIRAILFRAAGLMDTHIDNDWEWQRLNRIRNHAGSAAGLASSSWRYDSIRPANSPHRRIAALSCLVHRHGAMIIPNLVEPLRGEAGRQVPELVRRLSVTGHGYWSRHYAFGRPLKYRCATVGKQRATDIIVNIILPFALATARRNNDTKLGEAALATYSHVPLPGSNEISRHMAAQLAFNPHTACEEQGLIFIYRNWCRSRNCRECPMTRGTGGAA